MHEVTAKSILSAQNGINLYRGCVHGCIYCDSRSSCYHMDHAFTDIEAKINAPELLEQALEKKRSKCMISTGSMCDPYMPVEKELQLTRRCVEIIEKHGFGFAVLSKSTLMLRDLELFQSIEEKAKCVCQMTLTTADEELCRIIEPGVSTTLERFSALSALRDAGVPTVAWLSPFLPFINDTEENIRRLFQMCREAGVKGIVCFGIGLTLREGNREYFYACLEKYFPGLKEKYEKAFGFSYGAMSPANGRLMGILSDLCEQHHMLFGIDEVFQYLRKFPTEKNVKQLSLFDA